MTIPARIQDSAVHRSPVSGTGADDMQRDMDLVRTILLRLDESPTPLNLKDLQTDTSTEEDYQALIYHLTMLTEQVGFVSGVSAHTMSGKNWINLSLTWAGHEFLDNIRDPEVWRQTKAGAAKVGGFSLKVLASVAEAVLKARIEGLFAG